MKLFVSNVGCHITSTDLYLLFAAVGDVSSAHIVIDKETGKSLRYGFVEMPQEPCARKAIGALHGKILEGRAMSVTIARDKNEVPGKQNEKAALSQGQNRRSPLHAKTRL